MLKVARSTYYNHLKHVPSNREIENNIIKSKIFKIYQDSKRRYGCTKIMRILRQGNYPKISVNRVCRLMKQLNIKSIVVKKFRNYRQKLQKGCYENIVNHVFTAAKPNQIWLSDITYIHTI